MHTARVLSNQHVLEAIQYLARRADGPLRVSDLCFFLGARRESIEHAVRNLEGEGRVLCTSPPGAVALAAPLSPQADLFRGGAPEALAIAAPDAELQSDPRLVTS